MIQRQSLPNKAWDGQLRGMTSALRITALAAVLLAGGSVRAQTPLGELRGRITDGHTFTPVPFATVEVMGTTPPMGAMADSTGHFALPSLPIGIHSIRFSHVGYEPRVVQEVWIRSGKATTLDVALQSRASMLSTFTVSTKSRTTLEPMGVRTFTVEQGLRYPAMFQDPARLVTSTPGVAAPNDQANHLSIRGNSPNANAWLLEGAEIVSPNHMGNAGTPTDLPTLSGGGVNILSAQMLGPSRLRTGVSPAMYGNALGGLLDMELRRGDTEEREWTVQAGLIGLDLSTEGPIGNSGKAFHLVNYRYSTVGVLGAMGVDLGDEAIGFQDLSFHLGTKLGERGEVRLFGMGGLSSNKFEAIRDTTAWEFDKDSRDITYTSSMGALGSSISLPLGRKGQVRSTVVWSALQQEREETFISDQLEPLGTAYSAIHERKLSSLVMAEPWLHNRFRVSFGAGAMERSVDNLFAQQVGGWLLRPFANVRWDIGEQVQIDAGAAFSHFTYNGVELLEPRMGVRWQPAAGHLLSASYGVRGQLPHHQLLNMRGFPSLPDNSALGLMRSEDLVVGYAIAVDQRLSVRAEAYQQRLSRIPVLAPGLNLGMPESMGTVNVWDEPLLLPQRPTGNGQNTGVELSVDRSFDQGWFAQVNGTVYKSSYTDASGAERDSRWNSQWMGNAMGGKEWRKEKDDRVRTWGVSMRLFAMGGLRYTPLDIRAPEGMSIPVPTGPEWSAQFHEVFRSDLRVYRKMDRKGRTAMWALDLQNLTNARNAAFIYFDQRKGEVVTKYQLGLIPNLSYRVEFKTKKK